MNNARITASDQAKALLNEIKAENEGTPLIFHQAGGCCEGTKPSLYKQKRFRLRKNDVCIGEVEGVEFWVDKDLFEYWKFTRFELNVVEGIGSGGFSLEVPKGKTFQTKHEILTEEELQNLPDLKYNV